MKKFSILFSFLFLPLVISFSHAQSGWFTIYTGSSEIIRKIQFLDSNIGYAAGTHNILKSTNGGINWFSVKTNTSVTFYSLYFLNNSTGLAGGVSHYLCKTTNGGINWFDISVNYDCMSINFGNENTGYVTTGPYIILKTINTGENWQQLFVGGFIMRQIYFINGNTGYTVGTNHPYGVVGIILKTIDGGEHWGYQYSNCTSYFISVFFPINNVGFVANTCIVKTQNGGSSWSPVITNTQGNFLTSIYFCNENTGFVVGGDVGHGIIFRTTNGGNGWYNQNTSIELEDVFFINCSTGFISCEDGYILKTTTGGTTAIEIIGNEVPEKFELFQNYPNPFNPETKIKFGLPYRSKDIIFNVRLIIYDVLGKGVTKLVDEKLRPGIYEVEWNAENLPCGVYLYRIEAGTFVDTKKMVLVK